MKMILHSSSLCWRKTFTSATQAVIVLVTLFFSFTVQAQTAPPEPQITEPAVTEPAVTEPAVTEPVITAKVNPIARLTIYKTVAMLPAVVDGKKIDSALSKTLYQGLLELQKYNLLPLETSEAWLEKNFSPDKPFSPIKAGRKAGIDLQANAVIIARVNHRQPVGKIIVGAQRPPVTIYDVTLIESRSQKTVWSLSITRQDEQQQPAPQEQVAATIQQALAVLGTEMVNSGDIFSTQLPQPEILSSQGDLRSVRIVIQPDPPHIFSSYQLLRAESKDTHFSPVSSPVANKAPLILTDNDLEDATSYFYTVIGLTDSGFANVPAPPFKVITTGPPSPVTTLQAIGGGLRQIQLSWEPSQDSAVNEYIIFRATKESGPFEQIAVLKGREKQIYIDKGQPPAFSRFGTLKDAERYFYTIHTRNIVDVESSDSKIISAVTKGAPIPPSGVRAIERQPRRVPITWTASLDPDVKGYAIFRSQERKGPFLQTDYVSDRTQQEYVDQGSWEAPLLNNTTYYYVVRAVNVVDVHSADSTVVVATTKAAPVTVENVTAENGLLRNVPLSWQQNPEPDIIKYEIFRGTSNNGVRKKIATVDTPLTLYEDTGLDDGRMYWYQIRAIDRDGLESELSTTVQATTKRPPLRPLGLHARINGAGVQLSWDPNSEDDIDHYDITTSGLFSGLVGQTKRPFFLYTQEEKPGTVIHFKVRAVDSDGLESEFSKPLSVIIPK